MHADDAETQLAALLAEHAGERPWEHRRPRVAWQADQLLKHLPASVYRPSGSFESEVIAAPLRRSRIGLSSRLQQAVTMLELPEAPRRYDEGRERATQRRKARQAERLGVTWRVVDDPAEKQRLLDAALDYERNHPQEQYRSEAPEHGELLDIDLWLVAEHEGAPLLLSVTPVDGAWSLLRYFRTLQEGPAASAARYLMTGVLAEELIRRGVRHLCDTRTPFRLPAGLQHFSRMVGFRVRRVKVETAPVLS
ncbi:hypothetical protein ASG49_03855 [Marmoricola sp. Leaf446]|uniref:hypothetical protein n=1 Tax=Marmoricola sp. Leaf446 TaxID=1736379 RepID=UPI0006F70365|nr:hypothetical protein [Marmoricola sp. Leaf446]KQT94064.1 hypothetical protein ASG49_03855 [Marmoricola sp. Leaf446]